MSLAFIDLKAQLAVLDRRIQDAITRVLDHGSFISGPEVWELEGKLAEFCGARHAITCANGTDALRLTLLAEGIGARDAVFVPSFTFVATAEVIPLSWATPVFVDVCEDTFNMDPASLEAAIEVAIRNGFNPRAVIPVDLFGLPADYAAINTIAQKHGMTVIADSAQSFGARYNGKRTGSLGTYTTTSFFPAKPLGCYGDGGAIFTDDDDKAALLRSLTVHGKGADKYDNVRIGVNSRLDTLQAGILLEKLAIFEGEIEARNRAAAFYSEQLRDVVETPIVSDGLVSVWAQYTIKIRERDRFAAEMKAQSIPTAIYYSKPLHLQTGYRRFLRPLDGLPVSEKIAREVISLPMHPYLDEETQVRIVTAVKKAVCIDA